MDLRTPLLQQLFDMWLAEDLGRGDLTRDSLSKQITKAHWISKQKGIFCGKDIVKILFKKIDESVEIQFLIEDGESFEANQELLRLEGCPASLVTGERTCLNLAMHLSGIATATAKLVKELEGSGVHLGDTRKTTPGLRILEKYAFKCGGGINHRLGLDDAAMLKENHIAWSGGITASIKDLKKAIPWSKKIIVEAETPEQAKEAAMAGADWILLDEMSPETVQSLVPILRNLNSASINHLSPNQLILEVSGINPKMLRTYASTGVDLISTSHPITRSSWIDFSMRFNPMTKKNT